MSNLRFREYAAGDLGRLPSLRSIHNNERIVAEGIDRASVMPNAHLRTIIRKSDEQVLAIVGLVQQREGVAEAFTVTSNEVLKYPVSYTKIVKLLLRIFEEALSLHRVQMLVVDGFEPGSRWAGALGFECEGRLKKYGPTGDDYFMFARVKHG